MSMFRLCSQSVRFSSVVGFQSASTTPFRFTTCARISDGPKNLLVLGFGQKSPNHPLSQFVGTRHYSTVTRIQDYMFWPVKKCLSCVTFFTGRFETVPFTHQRLYVFPWIEKISGMVFSNTVKNLNKNGLVYPKTHPLCVRFELIAIKILEALQRETGRRHKLADRQWLLKYDGTLKVVKKIREENVKSTSDHLMEGIDWEFMVVDDPHVPFLCYSPEGKILVTSCWFDVCKTDDELAIIIATEVGHVVARHVQREFYFWPPCILYHRIVNRNDPTERYRLSNEHEADYIGMLLSASAGYDPRVVPVALQKMDAYQHNFHLKERVKYISQPEVMQKAVDIYEERRTGQAVN